MKAALLVAALLGSLPAPAGAEAGRTAAGTLSRPLGARAAGLADAFSAVEGGLDSLSYNVAGLARLPRPEVKTDYMRGSFDDNFSFLGFAQPVKAFTLTAGLAYYDAGTIPLNLSNGVQETRRVEQDWYGLLGGAAALPGGLSVGAAAKYYRLTLAQEATARGAAFDAGALWRTPLSGLSLGAAIQNAGPDVKFEQEADPLPRTLRAGAAFELPLDAPGSPEDARIGFNHVSFTADAISRRDERLVAAAGLEARLPLGGRDFCAMRLGYVFNSDADSVALGLGLREGRLLFDYALGVKKASGVDHHFSLGLRL